MSWDKQTEERLRNEHREARHAACCWKCDVPWPCPTIAALDEIRRLREGWSEAVRLVEERMEQGISIERERAEKAEAAMEKVMAPGQAWGVAVRLGERAEAAERDAQAQRERADNAEASLKAEHEQRLLQVKVANEAIRLAGKDREVAEERADRLKDRSRADTVMLQGNVEEMDRLKQRIATLEAALNRVLTEAGLQAHKHGCPNRLARPARWDEFAPCAGCQGEDALAVQEVKP